MEKYNWSCIKHVLNETSTARDSSGAPCSSRYYSTSGFGILSSSFSYIVLSLYICQDGKYFF